MKKAILTSIIMLIGLGVFAQKIMTRTGTITFYSSTPMEDIQAVNNQVSSIIALDEKQVVISMLMKAFTFEKALMQEHFNEKYLETDKFPKATFSGIIIDKDLELSDKPKEVSVKGKLTIHGITKDVAIKGKLHQNKDGKILGTADFNIKLADYNIKVPSVVRDNISEQILIKCSFEYDQVN